jgi:hypothetical protein
MRFGQGILINDILPFTYLEFAHERLILKLAAQNLNLGYDSIWILLSGSTKRKRVSAWAFRIVNHRF